MVVGLRERAFVDHLVDAAPAKSDAILHLCEPYEAFKRLALVKVIHDPVELLIYLFEGFL